MYIMTVKAMNPDNSVNETQSNCFSVSAGMGMWNEQPEPGRHHATAHRG